MSKMNVGLPTLAQMSTFLDVHMERVKSDTQSRIERTYTTMARLKGFLVKRGENGYVRLAEPQGKRHLYQLSHLSELKVGDVIETLGKGQLIIEVLPEGQYKVKSPKTAKWFKQMTEAGALPFDIREVMAEQFGFDKKNPPTAVRAIITRACKEYKARYDKTTA